MTSPRFFVAPHKFHSQDLYIKNILIKKYKHLSELQNVAFDVLKEWEMAVKGLKKQFQLNENEASPEDTLHVISKAYETISHLMLICESKGIYNRDGMHEKNKVFLQNEIHFYLSRHKKTPKNTRILEKLEEIFVSIEYDLVQHQEYEMAKYSGVILKLERLIDLEYAVKKTLNEVDHKEPDIHSLGAKLSAIYADCRVLRLSNDNKLFLDYYNQLQLLQTELCNGMSHKREELKPFYDKAKRMLFALQLEITEVKNQLVESEDTVEKKNRCTIM